MSFISRPFPLVDVTVIPDDEIVRHRRVALLELIQKHIRQRDLMGIVEQLTTILLSGDANDRQLKTLFNYLLQTGNRAALAGLSTKWRNGFLSTGRD